jgi:hypothetical protein
VIDLEGPRPAARTLVDIAPPLLNVLNVPGTPR